MQDLSQIDIGMTFAHLTVADTLFAADRLMIFCA
jgi:hypothetical protein